MVRHRAWTPYYLVRYLRLILLRVRQPSIILQGMVFLGRRVELEARPGYGRIILGGFVHIGDGTALRAHEGTLRVGDKAVIGGHTIVNSYLDVEIGPGALIADYVYIGDFDHRTDDMGLAIKDQGIVKAPVRIGAGCWVGIKATVLRGCSVGDGAVVGANSVVTRHVPPYTVVAGAPARVIADRQVAHAVAARTREALADIEVKTARAARDHANGVAD
ncbi:acyltransferase [soil metagenome]